ncbi:retrovirus-related pol polyprotein from transposon TNT 1-94, partial [Trifolium medium]|nr:retrovirus-related pol polyprotein from transposon TNT 1-94 [Trifolium medium]
MAYQSFSQFSTDFTTNSANPYYLHPNESPALVLVSPPLDSKNYHTWSRSMHVALISKNKERFIDSTLLKPTVSDPLYAPWIRCNTMVLAWLQRSISDSIAKSVLWIDNAAGVWKNLKIRFSQSDIFRISDIQEDLYKFRQGNKIRFLKGLNEKFTHSKSQIMMMNLLPDIDKAFSLVIQQEREMNCSVSSFVSNNDSTEPVVALLANSQQGNHFGKNGQSYNKGK